ncbi:tRNA pseudouridine(55) synthase TruB [Mesobacillus zeae]|uniref:tRNA pseudouridine synthase B n=1 Tax=Mesobacillus zeae TaxID=1917180 RepID=A0A398BKV0_9BACI|nr:tRNA pseudouridine(55) synthase TruB [Mesobacillus zeae]RID88036.1 tRNA pseudouridine(55) synthase TruB [Mesobacillus zeae]
MEGILPLYKPAGMTSHDCIFRLRKILRMKRIGHTGTLDPDVTGVLPICIGKATKVAEYITDAGKSYEGEVTLGFSTATEDSSGEVIEEKRVDRAILREEIVNTLTKLTGEVIQTPPMFSAVKVNGKRLYEYARQGIEVDRPSRKVNIYSIELLDDRETFEGDLVSFRFRVSCSKGTYIRTLAVTIGDMLGYPAHMSYLQRYQSASFLLEDCHTFAEIEEAAEQGRVQELLRPLDEGVSHLPKFRINDTVAEKVRNGAVLEIPENLLEEEGPISVCLNDGTVLAIYRKHPAKPGLIKPDKVIRNEPE